MLPGDLQPGLFAAYPPRARALMLAHLAAIRPLPLSFLPNLLREVIDYDYKFPAEQRAIDREFANLGALTPQQRNDWFASFSRIKLSSELERQDWINQPAQFVEQLSAYLWTTHQLDLFRQAATAYGDRLRAVAVPQPLPVRRLGISVIGQGVATYDAPLFRNLRPHGVYFSNLKPGNGVNLLLNAVEARAKASPGAYGHWYIDGAVAMEHDAAVTCVSYGGLEPTRGALLKNVQTEVNRPGMGPEALRTHLARLSPSELGMAKHGDPVLDRFQLKLLTEGSGTQIFATTFAQWATREALRRAQPLSLMVRFAPRQREKPMNELLATNGTTAELDLAGSVVDADMAAYYHWLNQQRLPGAEQSVFLAWFESHAQAVAIGPSMPRGTESNAALTLDALMKYLLS